MKQGRSRRSRTGYRLAQSRPRSISVRTFRSPRTPTSWPGVATKIRPFPHRRVQTAGEVTGRCQGSQVPDLLGGGGQYVVVGIAQHPVLLRDQLEVADPLGDRMAGRGGQHGDGVPDEAVGLLSGPVVGVDAGVRGELATDQLQIVGVSVGVDDAAMPAGQTGSVLDSAAQSVQLRPVDRRHGHALQDQVDVGHEARVGEDLGRFLHANVVAVLLQERDEQLGRRDRLMALPATAHHQRRAGIRQRHHAFRAGPAACDESPAQVDAVVASGPAFA